MDAFPLLKTKRLFATSYHPKRNCHLERFDKTILKELRHYTFDHTKERDLYTDVLSYACNTKVHRTTRCTLFEIVLAKVPQPVSIDGNSGERMKCSNGVEDRPG